ncbi:MAG TPA: nucleoid-associated protein [Gammaproteobacteria bacterium]
MEVKAAVIHQIAKEAASTDIAVTLAPGLLPLNDTVARVGGEVRKIYGGSAVYGLFRENSDVYWFQKILEKCVQAEWQDFMGFSTKAMEHLEDRMRQKQASAGGYVLFLRYSEADQDFLFVLMLNDKVGASVTSDLKLKDTLHLDLSKLYVAARINVTKWLQVKNDGEEHKYVSFVRGKREVSEYFVDFIGCTALTKPKESTEKIINIVNDFIRENGWKGEQKHKARETVAEYLLECAKNKKEASVAAIATRLFEDDPEIFQHFAAQETYAMNAYFHVEKASLSRLIGVNFQEGKFSIRMSAQYVRDNVALKDGSLVIRNIPETLKNEIEAIK